MLFSVVCSISPSFHPYLRGNYAFYSKIDGISGNGWGIGGGVKFDVTPNARLFVELIIRCDGYDHAPVVIEIK